MATTVSVLLMLIAGCDGVPYSSSLGLIKAEDARSTTRSVIDWPGNGLKMLADLLMTKTDKTSKGKKAKTVEEAEDKSETLNACEHTKLDVDCGQECINLRRAIYGRTDPDICPHISVSPEGLDCMADATQKVKSHCWGKRSCQVKVDNKIVGDPCLGTLKYLSVEFACESCRAQALDAVKQNPKAGVKQTLKKAFDEVSNDDLQKMENKFQEDLEATTLSLIKAYGEGVKNLETTAQMRLRECVEAVNQRKSTLGYTDESDMSRCATLSAVALAEVERKMHASQTGQEQWDPAERDLPLYGKTKKKEGNATPRTTTLCKRSTSVEILVSMQKFVPFWPLHIDDPCPR